MDPALMVDLREAVDEVWSERIRLLPMLDGRPDAERSPVEIGAVLRTGERTAHRSQFGRGNNDRAGVAAAPATLRIDLLVYPGLVLRKKDKVVALDRGVEPVFEVTEIDDRSHLRLICGLAESN